MPARLSSSAVDAGVLVGEAHDRTRRHRLARPRLAEQRDELAVADGEVHLAHGRDVALAE